MMMLGMVMLVMLGTMILGTVLVNGVPADGPGSNVGRLREARASEGAGYGGGRLRTGEEYFHGPKWSAKYSSCTTNLNPERSKIWKKDYTMYSDTKKCT